MPSKFRRATLFLSLANGHKTTTSSTLRQRRRAKLDYNAEAAWDLWFANQGDHPSNAAGLTPTNMMHSTGLMPSLLQPGYAAHAVQSYMQSVEHPWFTAGPNDLRAYSSLPRYDPSGPDPPPPEPYLTVRLSNRLHRQEESEDSASDSPAGEEADGLIANAAQHSNSGASDGSPGSSSSAGAGAGSGAGSGSSTPSASAQPVVHYPPSYAALAAVAHGNGNGGSQTHNSMPPIAMHRTHYGWSFTMPLGHDNVELATIHEDPDYPDYPDYPSIDSVNFSQMFI